METWFKKAARTALDLIYPPDIYCLSCGDTMEGSRIHGVCDVCAAKIDWNTQDPFRHMQDTFAFDRVLPCCRYGFYPRRIISTFKLKGNPHGAKPLARLLAERLQMENYSDVLLAAVPMHKEKQQQRGFNQAELLAKETAALVQAPFLSGLLIKKKATRSMRLSDAATRTHLYRDEFEACEGASSRIKGKHIILVDDVVTTGSTADACARVLKQQGAAKVSILCFACAPDHIFVDMQGQNDV
ncbi:MAG: ComF family protein [Firmicutes bacterium]|nr:ComF family protein [Bacillota bacterium]